MDGFWTSFNSYFWSYLEFQEIPLNQFAVSGNVLGIIVRLNTKEVIPSQSRNSSTCEFFILATLHY